MTSGPVDRILWQRLDSAGLEWCEIRHGADGTRADGIAIELDAVGWTRRAVIRPVGPSKSVIELQADEDGRWVEKGVPVPILDGCLDVDLGFSPMTNSLPIWRLGLAPGETRAIRAAWVRFPDFTVEVLRQTYERTAEGTYVYRSDGFEARPASGR